MDHKVQVFISHISEEQAEALRAKNYLEQVFKNEIDVFTASSWTSISPGQDWFQCVTDAIERAEIMLVLCSGDSVNRPWIQFETGAGWFAKKTKIIPVCHKGMTPAALPEPIRRIQALDMNGNSEGEQLSKLAQGIRQAADLPEPAPVAAESLSLGIGDGTKVSSKGWFTRPAAHINEEFAGMFKVGMIDACDRERASKAGLDPEDSIYVRLFQEPPTGQFFNCIACGKVAALLEEDNIEGAVITAKLKLAGAYHSGIPEQKAVPLIVVVDAQRRPG